MNAFNSLHIPKITKSVKWIIIINISIFIISSFFKFNWFKVFGLIPSNVISSLNLWQILTYMFFHAGVLHLSINMLMLWFLGCDLERIWGKERFLYYYFLTGIGAAVCSILVSFSSVIPIVGASGAVFGLLVAYAVLFPETMVYVFFIFPMKIKHAVLIFGAINLFGALQNSGSNIAYFAHIGGGLTGYIYLKRKKMLNIFPKIYHIFKNAEKERKNIKNKKLDSEADRILDKISKKGMNSLTYKEKSILNKKSKKM